MPYFGPDVEPILSGATTVGPFEISRYPPQPGLRWFDDHVVREEEEPVVGNRFQFDWRQNQVSRFPTDQFCSREASGVSDLIKCSAVQESVSLLKITPTHPKKTGRQFTRSTPKTGRFDLKL